MRKSRYTGEQIAFALRMAETGTPVKEVMRKMCIAEQTFYRWKKPYGGLGPSELRRLKRLEEENRRLKQMWQISVSTSLCSRTCSQENFEVCS